MQCIPLSREHRPNFPIIHLTASQEWALHKSGVNSSEITVSPRARSQVGVCSVLFIHLHQALANTTTNWRNWEGSHTSSLFVAFICCRGTSPPRSQLGFLPSWSANCNLLLPICGLTNGPAVYLAGGQAKLFHTRDRMHPAWRESQGTGRATGERFVAYGQKGCKIMSLPVPLWHFRSFP